MIDEALKKAMDFSTRKRGDTPTDSYQLTPRGYVDHAALTADRPASVTALDSRQFFNLSVGYPWFYNPYSSVWVSATGSTVGRNL